MTRHETFTTTPISEKEFVLATDLDGTFLGGSDEDRARFYKWIENNRDRVGLIFVTGRDPGYVSQLTRKEGVPRPEFVVGDVGTTIAEMGRDHLLSPIASLEQLIADAWGESTAKVQAALHRFQGLTLQSSGFRYRMSYDMDPAVFDPAAVTAIEEIGLDALVSDNRFFDVLPKGVSKGPSLKRLLAHLGIDPQRTLVAGDTLNDLSMLEMGLPAVAVGGSEAGLLKKLDGNPSVHLAKGVGVAGIAEAIMHHNLFAQA